MTGSTAASGIDARLLATLERAFDAHAGSDARIDLPELQKALGLRSVYLARRILQIFDTNGDGVVTKDEFLNGVRTLIFGSDRDKLFFAFRLHDHDGDGSLDRTELERMISISLAESEIAERGSQTAGQLASVLLTSADKNRDGRLSFDEFAEAVLRRPELLQRMTRNEAIWISPNEELLLLLDERAGTFSANKTRYGGERGIAPAAVLTIFFALNAAMFVVAWILGARDTPPSDLVARAGRSFALCADLNGALILLPVMRRLLTRVRPTWLGRLLPVDEAIAFHGVIGHTLLAAVTGHIASFITAFALGHAGRSPFAIFTTSKGMSGIVLFAIFAVIWFFSLALFRRTRFFQLFYFTHLLYVVWFVIAIAHAPRFAYWVGVPIAIFVIEQLVRVTRRGQACAIPRSEPLRAGVTRLEVERPAGFTFHPSDYCFLCIPEIAAHEWHPFTISSAPERDRLVFHVRSLGDWTGALRARVDQQPNAPDLTAFIDGPYGTPSGHIFNSRFAVLIAAGIGVTPFASVLESLVLGAAARSSGTKLEKVHFFWLNTGQQSFQWFADLLAEIERIDTRGILEIHLCLTGTRMGVSALGLEIARDFMKSAKRSDIITGLRTHTHVGAPDWDAMFGAITSRHAGETVHVFYCGPPGLEKKVRPVCERHGMPFRVERF